MTLDRRKQLVGRYWKFVKPYRFVLLLIILLGMLQFAVPLVGPWMTKVMIDQVLPQKPGYWTLNKVVVLLACVYVFGAAINFIRNYITSRLGNRMVLDIRRQLYDHLQTLSQRFYDNRRVGSIASRITSDVNGAQNLIGNGVINLAIDLFLVFFAGFMLFHYDHTLAFLALAILPLYYLTFTNMNVHIRYAWRSVHRQMERISGVLVERIGGIRVVQAFDREQTELERFDKQTRNNYHFNMSAQLLSNLLSGITQTFSNIGGLIVWFAGGGFVISGRITIGELIAFQAYLSQMYGPIQRFSNVNVTIQNSLTNIERIFEVFDHVPEITNREHPLPLDRCRGDIVFEHISFSYVTERPDSSTYSVSGDPDIVARMKPPKKFYFIPPKSKSDPPPMIAEKRLVLERISFHAEPGQVVAIVGPSGAGKSTLINFIPRFYDPDEGRVLLDGIDLREYDFHALRRQIALVLQDNILFSGSVYENIMYGNPDADRKMVVAAAKAANAHDFIMEWDQQYETLMGERGVRLSGGQKQRIAIARALLRDPRILILDEATSALDAESETLVTEALSRLMENRTTFVIAHRLATVVRADQILVMDRGRIVERGTHKQLLKKNGMYRELYEKQLKAMRPEELSKLLKAAT